MNTEEKAENFDRSTAKDTTEDSHMSKAKDATENSDTSTAKETSALTNMSTAEGTLKSVDLFERLPSDVFHHLFSFLGIGDRARCSVLSKRWLEGMSVEQKVVRFTWDELMFLENKDFSYWGLHAREISNDAAPCIVYNRRIREKIRAYMQSDAAKTKQLDVYEIGFCFACNPMQSSSPIQDLTVLRSEFKGWISYGLEREVKSLAIFRGCPFECHNLSDDGETKLYQLRPSVAPVNAWQRVKHFRLGHCILGKDFGVHFISLESLDLLNVDLSERLQTLVEYMTKLRVLKLEGFVLTDSLCLTHMADLEVFIARRGKRVPGVVIELSNQKLVQLELDIDVACDLKKSGNLEILMTAVTAKNINGLLADLRDHSKLSRLHLIIVGKWRKWLPDAVMVEQVRHLSLTTDMQFWTELKKVVAFLEMFPSMESLSFHVKDTDVTSFEYAPENDEEAISYEPPFLTQFSVDGFGRTSKQQLFAIHLLKHAPCLGKMVLNFPKGSFPQTSRFYEEAINKVILLLQKFDGRKILEVKRP